MYTCIIYDFVCYYYVCNCNIVYYFYKFFISKSSLLFYTLDAKLWIICFDIFFGEFFRDLIVSMF